ncbi:MAG: glycoside hydrolase family 97 catalytic domain-containing protein [Bacteroidaceae bacterium]|nr:glycoside hydrolase family 97 catalytic domain-containing protein [Bacteroidaceae bacterium]
MKHCLLFIAAFVFVAFNSPLSAINNDGYHIERVRHSDYRILSPDKLTYLHVKLTDGRLTYSAGYRQIVKAKKKGAAPDTIDVPVLMDSPLGVYTNIADFSQNLRWEGTVQSEGISHQKYTLRQAKQRIVENDYVRFGLEVSVPESEKNGVKMWVEFRVFNNNIAYQYSFGQHGETSALVVTGEASGFHLPKDATAFICPQSDPMVGWMRSKPSYEENYIWDKPATTRSQYGQGWTFPCLFKTPTPLSLKGERGNARSYSWLLISETGVGSNYCASHLSDATPDGLFTIAFPMEGENNGFGSTGAQIGLARAELNAPWSPYSSTPDHGSTPWRTLTFGPSLKPIVETTIPWDVVRPLYEPSIDYQGSRNTWSWIMWQDPSINYDDQITYINLAADLGWEGCLIDGGWYEHIGRAGMEKLFAYCKQKGVRPWVWYNSNGGWNNAPQCARQCMHNSIVRKQEMRWLRDGGVAGIKVDFFGGDKQETMRLYEGILSDANDYGIQVIFHGCTLPRGWERMYPNYCSSEAVLASENLYFSQGFCEMEARHACLHPFVRNAVASMEYGGTVLQKRLHREPDKGNTRRTSDIFELATAIAFQSSGQNFALTPRNLTEQPQFELDFMRQVPTTWDETRFIDGYPGKYIIMARRHADRWYVIAMNAEEQAKPLTINLSELGDSAVKSLTTLLHDGSDGKTPQQSPLRLDKRSRISLTLQPQCAAVIY